MSRFARTLGGPGPWGGVVVAVLAVLAGCASPSGSARDATAEAEVTAPVEPTGIGVGEVFRVDAPKLEGEAAVAIFDYSSEICERLQDAGRRCIGEQDARAMMEIVAHRQMLADCEDDLCGVDLETDYHLHATLEPEGAGHRLTLTLMDGRSGEVLGSDQTRIEDLGTLSETAWRLARGLLGIE